MDFVGALRMDRRLLDYGHLRSLLHKVSDPVWYSKFATRDRQRVRDATTSPRGLVWNARASNAERDTSDKPEPPNCV